MTLSTLAAPLVFELKERPRVAHDVRTLELDVSPDDDLAGVFDAVFTFRGDSPFPDVIESVHAIWDDKEPFRATKLSDLKFEPKTVIEYQGQGPQWPTKSWTDPFAPGFDDALLPGSVAGADALEVLATDERFRTWAELHPTWFVSLSTQYAAFPTASAIDAAPPLSEQTRAVLRIRASDGAGIEVEIEQERQRQPQILAAEPRRSVTKFEEIAGSSEAWLPDLAAAYATGGHVATLPCQVGIRCEDLLMVGYHRSTVDGLPPSHVVYTVGWAPPPSTGLIGPPVHTIFIDASSGYLLDFNGLGNETRPFLGFP